jgi:ABC-type transport system involved in multi-copper enzyme maturation permease subunit
MRIGLGPVFACERSIASRRWQTYGARTFLLSALLAAMATVAFSEGGRISGKSAADYAELGESYFYALIGVELALVLLAAPAATAGAICLDRSRGTLEHVLATDLSDAEIVLGKLAARLAPILALVVCTWPVMAISSLLGGIDPIALTLAFAITFAVAVLGCSLAFLLSVWARRTHEVVLVVSVLWLLALLAWPIWYGLAMGGVVPGPSHWLLVADPFYLAFAPYSAPNQIAIEDYLCFLAVTLSVSLVSIVLAVWRMRPVACRSDGKSHKGGRFGWMGGLSRTLPGPSLDRNPVLWREWRRLRPSAWMIAVTLLVWGATTAACLIGAYSIWRHGITPGGGPVAGLLAGIGGYVILILFGLLMLSVIAPTSMSEERQRGSLDVLVSTPLSTTAILLGKWWGTFRLVPFLAIGPGIVALAMATARVSSTPRGMFSNTRNLSLGLRLTAVSVVVATIVVYGAALVSLGLALATWIKRQSRAMATSVCIFALIAVAWPILVMTGRGHSASGLGMLSPLFSAVQLGEELTSRSDRLRSTLWWVGLWDAALAATAAGLFWVAARTFDEAFGRIPERPRNSHWMADVVVVVAAMTGAACLVRAVATWVQGVQPQQFASPEDGIVVGGVIVIELIGLILISVLAALSKPVEGPREAKCAGSNNCKDVGQAFQADVRLESLTYNRRIVLGRWCRVFVLALLLALAPGSIVLALATARDFWPEVTIEDTTFGRPPTKAVMVTYTTPTGETSRRIVMGERNDAEVRNTVKELSVHNPVLPFRDRLRNADLLMATFLAHAAAAASAGVALGIWIKRPRPRIVVAACLPLLVAICWPVCVYFCTSNYAAARWLLALSPIWVADHLLEPLFSRQPHDTAMLGWIAAWNAGLLVATVGMLCLAALGERRLRQGDAQPAGVDHGVAVKPSFADAERTAHTSPKRKQVNQGPAIKTPDPRATV